MIKKDKSIFRFEKLKEELHIESIDDIVNNKFLGDFPIKVIVPGHIREMAEIELKGSQLYRMLKIRDLHNSVGLFYHT